MPLPSTSSFCLHTRSIRSWGFVLAMVLSGCVGLQEVSAADTLLLRIEVLLNGQPVVLGEVLPATAGTNQLSIDRCRFYLAIAEHPAPEDYRLIDLSDSTTLQVPVPTAVLERLVFHFGVDSLTNNAGAHRGDLDPSRGMYWAWQSGYIDLKLEGERAGNPFVYHLGGFLRGLGSAHSFQPKQVGSPNQAVQPVLQIDLAELLDAAGELDHVMKPSASGRVLAKALTSTATVVW